MTGSTPIAEAVAAARRGELIVLPTDTVYGIATTPERAEATERLFAAKRRPARLTLPVLVDSVATARRIGAWDARAERLAAGCWPGALTIVLPRTSASDGWHLGGDPDSIGVRVPAHPLALAVLAGAGPLAATSANRSGEPPATSCDDLVAVFGDDVAVYLCQEEPLLGVASTVVSLLGDRAEILRAGDVAAATVERLTAG